MLQSTLLDPAAERGVITLPGHVGRVWMLDIHTRLIVDHDTLEIFLRISGE